MKRTSRWLAAVSGLAVAAAPIAAQTTPTPVGTAANTDITNTVQVDYSVGGVAQNRLTAADTFKVDRKVNVTVAAVDTQAVSVSPGQTNAVTTFRVTNNSNATLDYLLAAANQGNGAGAFTGNTDNFDVTNIRVFRESGANAGYQPGEDTAVSILNLASGGEATVYVVSDMIVAAGTPPTLPANGAVATVILTATAASGGTALQQSDPNAANGKMSMETIFADAAGAAPGDVERDGRHSAKSDYRVNAAQLAVSKHSRVVSDGLGTSNFRSVPGALVEYCIIVSNAAGSAAATNVILRDNVPTAMTYEPSTAVFSSPLPVNYAFNAATGCTVTAPQTTSPATFSGTEVSNAAVTINANEARFLRFQAKIK